jgi:hypothetical protein
MTKARNLADNALTTVSPTELGYVDGVTSAIQTQIDGKQAINANVSTTELGYLDGVTSAIQTQIDSKIGSASAINPTIVDAKGDIIAATAADAVSRLAVGANDTVLTADSTTATGLKWATPAAGGMTLLSTTSLSGSTTTISSISSAYTSLLIRVYNVNFSAVSGLRLQVNSTSNLFTIYDGGAGQAWGSSTTGNHKVISQATDANSANTANASSTIIDNYASTSAYKPVLTYGAYSSNNISSSATGFMAFGAVVTTSAVTSLTFLPITGTATGTVQLYGVK